MFWGVASREYKSHSFRVGAATTLGLQGCCNIDIIQAAGRWCSNAHKFVNSVGASFIFCHI